ncbi:hypothetical protein N0V88_007529 [Collariella sp. IMI 366227]|nr:hypothetical protein N0V88_007529 [Collariella sp. IMI 366227]
MELLKDATLERFDGFEVHTFQIHVPIGDCAIHLLVKNAARYAKPPGYDNTTPFPEQVVAGDARLFQLLHHRTVFRAGNCGTVVRAILFDGGHDNNGATYDGTEAAKAIKKVIKELIEPFYTIDNDADEVAGTPTRLGAPKTNRNQLVFDSWVVTHWDRDHYCGSLTMIRDDVFERNTAGKGSRCSYMKYDGNGKCLSVMYCPAWIRPPKKQTAKPENVKPKGAPSIFVKDLDNDSCATIYLSATPPKPLHFTYSIKAAKTAVISAPLFRVAIGEQNLMGVDFFSHGQFKPATLPMNTNWWEEAESDRLFKVLGQPRSYSELPEPTGAKSWPSFICIAVCGYVHGFKDKVREPPPTLRPALERPDAGRPTVDNYVSIIAALVWKTGPADQDVRVSHFCGGDAHMNTEMAVLSFLKDPNDQPLPIEVLKAGHHGSRSSTPVDLLLDCRPKKFIISAGEAHGHPKFPLISMRRPYYMLDASHENQIKDLLGLGDINLESYRGDGQRTKWQSIFDAAFPGDSEYSLDKPTVLPDPYNPAAGTAPKTHYLHFKKHFIDNPNPPPPDKMADYLYMNCSIPRALERLFDKWENDTAYTDQRTALREYLNSAAAKRKKTGKPKSKRKPQEQVDLEDGLEVYLLQQRFIMACFLRRCWAEMSRTASLYTEPDKVGTKMSCVAIYASPDADYDGRSSRLGTVGSVFGGVASLAYLWAPSDAQLPIQQGQPLVDLNTRAKQRWDVYWLKRFGRQLFHTATVPPLNPQPAGSQPEGAQPDGSQPDSNSNDKRKHPYDDESDYESYDDDDRSVSSEGPLEERGKRVHDDGVLDNSSDLDYESDDARNDVNIRPGDMALHRGILARADAEPDYDDDESVITTELTKDGEQAAHADSAMSIVNSAAMTTSRKSVPEGEKIFITESVPNSVPESKAEDKTGVVGEQSDEATRQEEEPENTMDPATAAILGRRLGANSTKRQRAKPTPPRNAPTPLVQDQKSNCLYYLAADARHPDLQDLSPTALPGSAITPAPAVKVSLLAPNEPSHTLLASEVVNRAFHGTGGQQGTQSSSPGSLGLDPGVSEEWMKMSGIGRFPGCVVLGLEGNASADGGIKTLADMFSLVGLTSSPWLSLLLSSTNITLTKSWAGASRNAMWFLPGSQFTSGLRLEGSIDLQTSFGGFIEKYLSSWKDMIPFMPVMAKKTTVPVFKPHQKYFESLGELTLGVELDIGAPRGLGVYTSVLQDRVTLMLVCYSPAVGWAALRDWLAQNCAEIMGSFTKLEGDLASLSASRKQATPATGDPVSQQQPSTDSNLNGIFWRKLSVTISDQGIHEASINLEASLPFLVPQGKHAVFDLSFTWRPGMYQFHGSFAGRPSQLNSEGDVKIPIQYNIDYERWLHLTPLVQSEEVMSLKYLSPGEELNIPHGVPCEIAALDLTISNKSLQFCTQLQSAKLPAVLQNAELPLLRIDRVFLGLDINVDYSAAPTRFSVDLDGSVKLKARYKDDPPFYLIASIRYRSGDGESPWSFKATAANIPMAALYSLFAGGSEQSAVVNMLRAIKLKQLSLGYGFHGGNATEVRFEAMLIVAGLAADVEFCRSSATDWTFSAKLSKEQPRQLDAEGGPCKLTLGGAVSDLLGHWVTDVLPEVIQGTELAFSGSENDKFSVMCTRHNNPPRLVFGAELSFGAMRVHFAQVADVTQRKATTNAEGKTVKPPAPTVKRVVRLALALPSISQELPLIGKLDLPCDGIEFLWANKDMTASDLETLNTKIDFLSQHPIALRDGDDMLAKGLHFRLLDHGFVLIDHAFSKTEKAAAEIPAPSASGESGTHGGEIAPVQPAGAGAKESGGKTPAAAGEPPTTVPLKKQKGSLKISGIGLFFDSGVLEIHLDARVSIGPIGAGIKGLAVMFNLSKAKGLHDLLKCDVDVRIDGFDMAFDRPPVMLAGALYHTKSNEAELYNGGVAISLSKFSMAALGQYAQVVAKHPDPAYDSFFVYGRLEGTLFTVGWAEITGLIAAFGFNSKLRLPEVNQLSSFPFLSGFYTPEGFSLEGALTSLTGPAGWVTPSMGSLWFGAGLLMRACQTLDIQALAMVALGPDQGEVAILARAQACLPRGSKPDDALMLIDLSLIGKLDFLHGEFSIQGTINSTSFILNKNCKPSGEFAIKSWFGDNNPHAGDWVVSFGGYHPSFRRPDHYPNPARLRISWAISSNLSVTGEAYAAVTPGAIMAGALLHACFQLGGLTAWFDAHADFLVNLKPLHYETEIAISAGISYEIRVWLIRTKISIELGASLRLSGPPLGGTVHFDLCIFSFDVHFGESVRGPPPALNLVEFLDLVLTETAPQDKQASSNSNAVQDMYKKAHVLSLTSGRVVDAGSQKPSIESNANDPPASDDTWTVRSNDFHFQVRSPVPISTASIANSTPTPATISGAASIASRPMHKSDSLSSTFSVAVRPAEDDAKTALPFQNSLPTSATAVAGEKHLTPDVIPQPAPQDTARYLGDEERKQVRERVRWERVRAAMKPKGARIKREEVLKEFLRFVIPVTEQERRDGVREMGDEEEIETWRPIGEKERLRSAYRRIGAKPPRVVLEEPRRFYRCPPMAFCG